jgi:hypothetical protein
MKKNKMKTNAFTDTLIKKLEGFRIDGCVSELLAEGMSDLIYSGWLSNNGIYGAAEDFPDEFDPELLRIIHEKREGREKLEFERAMNMVIIRKVLEEGLMMINDDGPGFDEDFTSWLLSVDDSVQKVYDLWEKEFADNKTEDSIDRYMYALSNTDLGNEMGEKVLRKICRGEIAAAEKAIELEPNGIGGYVGRGNAYYDLMYYEPDPIKKAAYKKKAREITETIRKMDPDDTRHDNRDRADAYYFFSEIEPDREKAREYTDKARAIRGLDSLAESESRQKAVEDKWKKKCKDDPKYTKFYFTIMLGVPYEKLIEPGFAEKHADYLYAVGLTPVEAEELFKSMQADSEAASESKRKYFGDMPADFLNAIGINPDVTKELFTKLIKEVISEIPADFLNAIGFNPDVTEELFTKSMKEALSEMKKEINE